MSSKIILNLLDVIASDQAIPLSGISRSADPINNHDYVVGVQQDQRAVDDLLLKQVIAMRKRLSPESVLFVVIGEYHGLVPPKMATAGLIDNLSCIFEETSDARWKPLLSIETPFNFLSRYIEDFYRNRLPDKALELLHEHDPMGHHFARAVLANNNYLEAPHSTARMLATALENNVPISLVDAGRKNKMRYLDESDKKAYEIAWNMFSRSLKWNDVDVKAKKGMDVRNEVMAQRAVDGVKKHEAGVVVLKSGVTHLGDNLEHLNYDTSLPYALLRNAGSNDSVLNVCFPIDQEGCCPEEVLPSEVIKPIGERMRTVFIRNTSDQRFSWKTPDAEEQTLEKLGASYGEYMPSRFLAPTPVCRDTVLDEINAIALRHCSM